MLNHLFGESSHIRTYAPPAPYHDTNLLEWEPGRAMDWHAHDYFQLIHVLAGALDVDTGDGWRRLKSGEAHLLPPGHAHRLRSPAGERQLGINFRAASEERGVLAILRERGRAPSFLVVPFDPARLRPLRTDLHAPSRQTDFRQLHALDAYLLALFDALRPETEQDEADALLSLLRTHWRAPLSVETLAARMHKSRATLQRFVHARFGCGAAKLAERLRLEEAARRLLESDLPLAACADVCGYRDVYHFSRAFRRAHGCPPGEFRRRHARRLG